MKNVLSNFQRGQHAERSYLLSLKAQNKTKLELRAFRCGKQIDVRRHISLNTKHPRDFEIRFLDK